MTIKASNALGATAAVAMLATLSVPAAATTIAYEGFASTAGLTLIGTASVAGSTLELTRTGDRFSIGGLSFAERLKVSAGFTVSFDFSLTPPVGGVAGDGLVAMFLRDGIAVGPSGGALGYFGTNSVAVEFDTYRNTTPVDYSEPNGNHIAVQSCGAAASNTPDHARCGIAMAPSLPVTLADGKKHRATIDYTAGVLSVELDGVEVLSAGLDLASLLALDPDGLARFQLLGVVGGASEDANLYRLGFTNDPVSTVPAPSTFAVFSAALAGIFAFKRRRSIAA